MYILFVKLGLLSHSYDKLKNKAVLYENNTFLFMLKA